MLKWNPSSEASLRSSVDGFTWIETALPDSTGDQAHWRLEASSWHDPVLFQSSDGNDVDHRTVWTLDRGQWETQILEGQRIITANSDMFATYEPGALRIFDRTANLE